MKHAKFYPLILGSLAILFAHSVIAGPPATPPVNTQGDGGSAAREQAKPSEENQTSNLPKANPLEVRSKPKPVLDGLRVGSFMVNPEISLTELFDDNIYSTRVREEEDWITVISPTISVKSDWTRHSLNFWAGFDADLYRDNSDQNVVDHWLEGEGRFDISDKTNVYAGLGISRNHEDRSSLADPLRTPFARKPTRYWETSGHLGLFHQFDDVSLRVGTTYEHLNYDNVAAFGGGTILMDDRDRKLYSIGGRVTYKLSKKHETFVQLATDDRRYDLGTVGRDSYGYRVAAGLGVDFGGNNKVEAFIGYLRQNYKSGLLADVSRPYFGAEGKFAVGPSTYVSAYLDRELGETTIVGASSFLDTTLGTRVNHDMSQDLSLNGRLAISRSQFQGISRDEYYLDAGFGAKYYVMKDVYIAGDYRLMLRETDANTVSTTGTQNNFDFDRNQVYVSLGYTPGRVPRPVATASTQESIFLAATDLTGLEILVDAPQDYSGFYVGGQSGYGAFNTEVFSRRSDGSADQMNLGKLGGQTSGLFAGFGGMWRQWYCGMEVEAEDSSASWYHKKDKADARTTTSDKNETYGIGLRLGYALPSGLLYGSYGVVRTNVDTYDTENQYALIGAFDKDVNLRGDRFGIGLDLPASNNLFVRMNYSYTNYESYNAKSIANGAGTAFTVDRMDNKESIFRVGMGWRFGSNGFQISQVDAAIANGFFVGAKVGYGAVGTDLKALHNDGGGLGCTNCVFTGDFSNTGSTWGFFGGYGTTINRFYLGLELEADASRAEWTNDRDSGGGGRDVAVSKKGSHGASAKLGYVLSNGTLLYGRAGKVRTRFNTIYNKGNVVNWVDRDDIQMGNRFGVGVEAPIFRNMFIKMDYTKTHYEDYGFITEHANADTEKFDNEESLFSLGLGMRF